MDCPKYSVIIPAYNAEKTLRRCVDSVLAQTFVNFEIILVDDGSDDSTPRLIDEYAERDRRVRAIHKSNGGVSSARNAGLENSSGEYIVFMDSDDAFTNANYLANMSEKSSDIIITGFVSSEGEVRPESYIVKNSEAKIAFLNKEFGELYVRTPWAKVFSADLIRNSDIRFDESLRLGEDTDFVLKVIQVSNEIEILPDIYYYYTPSPSNQLSKFKIDCDAYLKSVKILENRLKEIEDSGKLESCHNCVKAIFLSAFIDYLYTSDFKTRMNQSVTWIQRHMWKILPSQSKSHWKIKQVLKILFMPYYKLIT